jgi:hypothetical protein
MRMCLGKPVFRSGAPLKVAAAKPISSRRFWGKNSMEGFWFGEMELLSMHFFFCFRVVELDFS